MANNALNISYNASTSPTLYATVRQVATGKVWNAVAGELQTWSDGTLAEYAIPLGSQGGDLYAADMAAGITPGTYRAQFYKQAGNAPALTDTLIGSREFYWNGASASDPSDDPAGALITTNRATQNPTLASLNSSHPSLLASLIAAASERIRRECARDFNSQSYSHYFSGSGYPYDELQLRQFPVTAISRIACSPEPALRISNRDLATNQRATVATTSNGLTLVRVASGVTSTSTIAYSDCPTLEAVAAAIIDLGNGWEATVAGNYGKWPSADLRPLQGAANAIGGMELELYTEDLPPSCWRLQPETGILHGRFPHGVMNIRVDYTAGFTTVPEPIQEACVQLVLDMYQAGKGNANVQSYHLGPYGQTNAKGGNIAMSAKVRGLIAPYVDHASKLGAMPCR